MSTLCCNVPSDVWKLILSRVLTIDTQRAIRSCKGVCHVWYRIIDALVDPIAYRRALPFLWNIRAGRWDVIDRWWNRLPTHLNALQFAWPPWRTTCRALLERMLDDMRFQNVPVRDSDRVWWARNISDDNLLAWLLRQKPLGRTSWNWTSEEEVMNALIELDRVTMLRLLEDLYKRPAQPPLDAMIRTNHSGRVYRNGTRDCHREIGQWYLDRMQRIGIDSMDPIQCRWIPLVVGLFDSDCCRSIDRQQWVSFVMAMVLIWRR